MYPPFLLFAMSAYFLNAFSAVVDRRLLKSRIPDPLTFAFYTGITSIGVVFVVPLILFLGNIRLHSYTLSMRLTGIALLSGVALVLAFYFIYTAIKDFDVTRAVPLTYGVVLPMTTPIFAFLFSRELLTRAEAIAFVCFVLGGMVLALDARTSKELVSKKLLLYALAGGMTFAIATVLQDYVMSRSEFWTAIIWTRLGAVTAALLILLTPLRVRVRRDQQSLSGSSAGIFFGNKIVGSGGLLLYNAAQKFGSINIVNALKGSEFFFVFILTGIYQLMRGTSEERKEFRRAWRKNIAGAILIALGLYVLYAA
ncbi:MAG: EamA family transporter [Patescibacteria group bacterium]